MLPGALLCAAFGVGRDDFAGLFAYIAANALLYGVVFAALFASIRRRRDSRRRRNRKDAGSGKVVV
jgi:hypothetical protein